MGWFSKIFSNPIARIALPILATAVAPGIGTALSSGLGLGLGEAAAAGLGGAVAGGGAGALTGGGLKGALKGAALGGAGGYLANGGLTELAPRTSSFLGNTTGNIIGTGTSSTGSLGSLLGTSGLTDSIGNGLSSAYNGVSNTLSGVNPFSGSTASSSSGYTSNPALSYGANALNGGGVTADFAKALGAGTGGTSLPNLASGGGSSIFGGSGAGGSGLGSLLGTGYSLYANNQAQGTLTDAQKKAMGILAPYQATGQVANQQLSTDLQNGTLGGTFNPSDLTQDPGYQFNLKQGQQALDRKNAASGDFFSGAALKDAQTFGQGLADNTYNQAYQRWLQGQNNTYNMLSGTSRAGQQAAGAQAGLTTDLGTAKAAAGLKTSDIINQSLASLLAGKGRTSIFG